MPGEFELINRYFSFSSLSDDDAVILGVGDDAALIKHAGGPLVVASDSLVENVHFFAGTSPERIATRLAMVNLSDFAAMGAVPRWYTLSLTIKEADERWLEGFSSSLHEVSTQYGLSLVGGDTCKGPLNVGMTLIGESKKPLRRSGANPGDDLWVSGELGLGAAALALQDPNSDANKDLSSLTQAAQHELLKHFFEPIPQLALGRALAQLASAAIDVSDGLTADAAHIAEQSGTHIIIDAGQIPLPSGLKAVVDHATLLDWSLSGGDDYQLLFTASPGKRSAIEQLGEQLQVRLTRIGRVDTEPGAVGAVTIEGDEATRGKGGYQHF